MAASHRSSSWVPFLFFLISIWETVTLAEKLSKTEVISTFFSSSHIFQATPAEGITTVSVPGDGYLNNGDTGDMVSSFIFMPPSGFTPDQYTITYSCDSDTVAPSDSCVVDNVEASIVGSTATAFNTTVTCSFTFFPGTTSCNLYATLTSLLKRAAVYKEGPVSRQSTEQYVSQAVTVNIYGVVFYTPDSDGGFSASSIVSGSTVAYELVSYDRTDQGVREIDTLVLIPGQSSTTGSSAIDFFGSAAITVSVGDHILNYDTSACSLTAASFSNGAVALQSPDVCAIGMAVESGTSFPRMGVQFRTYKSGKFTMTMTWDSFGTSIEGYEQTIVFDITEQAPPVITAVDTLAEYRSTPCETETVTITGYNLRFASQRIISVTNSDGSTTAWPESSSGLTYDDATDSSVIVFDSAGGDGTNVAFNVIATYGTEEFSGVVLDSSLSLTMSFSSPPILTSMSPTSTEVDGGDDVTLTGLFDKFDEEGFVSIGGYIISLTDLTVTDSTSITFSSPPLSSLGQSYTYEVSVGICAETTSSLTLSYEVSPTITISSADTSVDDSGSYIIPTDGNASFVAEVGGNNDGIEYAWKLFASDGSEISTGDIVTNLQLFELSFSVISVDETYTIRCQGTNSLGLSAQDEVTASLAATGTEYVTVTVYSVENLTKSTETTTLVQSSVQVHTDSGVLSRQATSDIVLEWSYGGNKFSPDNSSSDESETGVTQLGLEFNIARKDLRVGKQELTLTAYLADNPDISGSSTITLNVVESPLLAVVNNGVNGSLILEGNDLVLFGTNSTDPDILSEEGDPNAGLSYSWFSCQRSLDSKFSDTQDCVALLFPSDRTTAEITIQANELSNARLDTSADPVPTYFSFGLEVSKGDRRAQAYTTFELRTLPTPETIPTLSSLTVVDVKGTAMDLEDVSIFSDVIILVESSNPDVVWSFDMAQARQKFLFTKSGVLKSGDTFVTSRGVKSRSLLGFSAGSLAPMTEYTVQVVASIVGGSLESVFEVTFTTADVPKLTCAPPLIATGTISETSFVISGSLSFEAQKMEYCFFLVSSPTRKYAVGKGCSPLNFAHFTFPLAGTFGIECLAKTVSGAVVANETLEAKLVLSTPTPAPDESLVGTLTAKLATLSQDSSSCETVRDHTCLGNLIASASLFAAEVAEATVDDTSAEALALIDGCREYYDQMSQISETLAKKTVYRPNQILNSIDQSFYMSQVPSTFVGEVSTLFSYLTAADLASTSTSSNTSVPIISDELVDKASAISNASLAIVFQLAQGGTSRRRLLQDEESGQSEIGVVLELAIRMIGQLRAQQETCGFSGEESTEHPSTIGGSGRIAAFNGAQIPPVKIAVKVSCTRSQISEKLHTTNVAVDVCEDALGTTELNRVVAQIASVPSSSIEATGYLTDIDSYVTGLGYLKVDGLGGIPNKCFTITMERNPEKLTSSRYDRLVGGTLNGLPTRSSANCTPETCYVFDLDESAANDVTFTDEDVIIQSEQTGLFIAGNYTAKQPQGGGTLEGRLSSSGAQALPIVGALLAFIVFAVVAVWVSVSNMCVSVSTSSSSGEEASKGSKRQEREQKGDHRTLVRATTAAEAMNWEYVDRDFFARPRRGDEDMTDDINASIVVPDGARPPQYDRADEPST